jgi:exosortase family protein XrtF
MTILSEFRPALMFLAKFLGIYLAGNILYGIWIESYGERADAGTTWVAGQTVRCLQVAGFETYTKANPDGPTVFLVENDRVVLSVFEGCNGVNVMIVFTAFLVAFGGPGRSMAWFLPLGLLVIHLSNLLRVSLLYYTAIHQPAYFYYFHKYFFTAVLYFVVFVLWALWVVKFNARPGAKAIH